MCVDTRGGALVWRGNGLLSVGRVGWSMVKRSTVFCVYGASKSFDVNTVNVPLISPSSSLAEARFATASSLIFCLRFLWPPPVVLSSFLAPESYRWICCTTRVVRFLERPPLLGQTKQPDEKPRSRSHANKSLVSFKTQRIRRVKTFEAWLRAPLGIRLSIYGDGGGWSKLRLRTGCGSDD